jgi:glycosyltransferase involved in cell wall biosynthesis
LKLLTITVPSYNVEITLHDTLNSLCVSEVIGVLDIIVVDDGSRDKTAEIAQQYVDRFPQSVRLISKQNGGHGSAVNSGIEAAAGKYFRVVDGDDRLDKSGLIALIERLSHTEVDLLASNYRKISLTNEDPVDMNFEDIEYNKIYAFEELPHSDKIYFGIHSMNIRTSILQQHKIRLQEHTFYVDVEYGLMPVPYIKTIEFFDTVVYLYYVGSVGQSINMTNFVNRYDDHYRVVIRMTAYCVEAVCSKRQREYMSVVLNKLCFTHYMLSIFYDEDKPRAKRRASEFDKWLYINNSEIYYNLAASLYIRTLRSINFKVLPPAIINTAVKSIYDRFKPIFRKKRKFTY